jgi:hypothetical protein
MPASKAEQLLEALKALLGTVPDAVVERNSVLPEKIPDGGRDGDPGAPEQALGGFGNAYYQHAVEIEVYIKEVMRRRATLRLTPSSSRSALPSRPIRRSATSQSA